MTWERAVEVSFTRGVHEGKAVPQTRFEELAEKSG